MEDDILNIEDDADENEDHQDDSNVGRNINADKYDYEIEYLYNKWKNGKINLQPNFQRGFIWDIKKASKLIESVLMDIPIPIVYLSREQNDIETVIDGQQRLTSLFSFIDGKLPNPNSLIQRPFKLYDLTIYKKYEGKTFNELNQQDQNKIKEYNIRIIIFHRDSDPNLKYEIFERLNSGSVSLNSQELRNCMFHGPYNDALKKASSHPQFQKLLGIKKPERRMRDVELMLRFAAFYFNDFICYKPTMKRFLNDEMSKLDRLSNYEKSEFKMDFEKALHCIDVVFGNNAFKRFYCGGKQKPNGRWEKSQFNASLYDIVMFSFAKKSEVFLKARKDEIRRALIELMTSKEEFIEAITNSTSSTNAVKNRFTLWERELDKIEKDTLLVRKLEIDRIEKIYNLNATCCVCQNPIELFDDAVKHSTSDDSNIKLSHRICNLGGVQNRSTSTTTNLSLPTTIRIQNTKIICKYYVDILREIAVWLVKNNYLKVTDCPIKYSNGNNRYLVSNSPVHPNGNKFDKDITLPNLLHLEGNFSAKDCILRAEFLLNKYRIQDYEII